MGRCSASPSRSRSIRRRRAAFFGSPILLVRVLHLVLSAIVARGDPDRWRLSCGSYRPTARRLLLVVAAFLEGEARIAVWMLALAIDYSGRQLSRWRGWRVAPEHFAERHGLIILIALGESIIAIGVGPASTSETAYHRRGARVRGRLGPLVALLRRGRDLRPHASRRSERHRAGAARERRVQLPPPADGRRHRPLRFRPEDDTPPRRRRPRHGGRCGLCGGAALYLLGHVAFLVRATGRIFRRRTIGGIVLLALIPAALSIPRSLRLAWSASYARSWWRGRRSLSRAPAPDQLSRPRGLITARWRRRTRRPTRARPTSRGGRRRRRRPSRGGS